MNQENTIMTRSVSRYVTALVAALALLSASPALAAAGPPVLSLSQAAGPTNVAPGKHSLLNVGVLNLSDVTTSGQLTVRYQLPAGVIATSPPPTSSGYQYPVAGDGYYWTCPGAEGANVVECTYLGDAFPIPAYGSPVRSLNIYVTAQPGATGVREGVITLTGGGIEHPVTKTVATTISADVPGFGIRSLEGGAFEPDGRSATQAGGHPNLLMDLQFNTKLNPESQAAPDGGAKIVRVSLPKGTIGNPQALPVCTPRQLNPPNGQPPLCPAESQVGVADAVTIVDDAYRLPVYNMEVPDGSPARFAFNLASTIVNFTPSVRAGDYGLDVDVTGISQTLTLFGTRVQLWGVPADPSHDALRRAPGSYDVGLSSTARRVPFITTPTECSGRPLVTTASASSWANPSVFDTKSFDTDLRGNVIHTDGCELLSFDPSTSMSTTTSQPDAPTGIDVAIKSPQNLDNPDGLAAAQLKDVTVDFPEGLTINPGAADGLEACSDAQLGLGNESVPSCPAASKVGTVSAKSPLLAETLAGDLYIRTQNSSDPESGEMFRLALVVRNDERGILIKLPGQTRANKDTGRLTATFKDNPQVPVESIDLRLKTGPRAVLATPASCGSKTIDTVLTSWAGGSVKASNASDVTCAPGLGGFAPSLAAGTVDPVAGGYSPFSVSIAKPDGNAALAGLRMVLPTGLLAHLKGNLGTQVGSVKAFAGPGSNPFMLPGKVFLEGPYGDAPFSLKVVVPAKAGPFDLGEVVVRQKIYVDPITAQASVVSDPVPTIVKGVPVRLQRLDVSVDKPRFIINPTSCAAKSIEGVLKSVADQTAALSVRFRVGECASLDLKPNLALSLSGKGQTTDGKHPAITATVTQKPGQSNLKKVRVTLPLSLALDPDNANGLCEFVDGSKVTPTCPKASIVGTATAVTPILDEPLSGPVYFVKNVRKDPKSGRSIRTTPKLVIPLVGQNGLKLTLTGTSDVEDDRLVTTFDEIPDAPVSSFKLNIIGGKGGILAVSGADICKSTQIADQQIDGQNNKQADTGVYIQTPSCLLKVLSKKVGKRSVAVKVAGLGAGKVTITGRGIKKTTKTISKSTVATITAKRSKGKPGKVTVSFDPTGPAKARKTTK
jgi:hypothetical protein